MKLGDKVTVATVLYRREKPNLTGYGCLKYWDRRTIKAREGIYIGKRTLSNGSRVWHGSEEGFEYNPQEYLQAALVVFSERERPVLVPMDALGLNDYLRR